MHEVSDTFLYMLEVSEPSLGPVPNYLYISDCHITWSGFVNILALGKFFNCIIALGFFLKCSMNLFKLSGCCSCSYSVSGSCTLYLG